MNNKKYLFVVPLLALFVFFIYKYYISNINKGDNIEVFDRASISEKQEVINIDNIIDIEDSNDTPILEKENTTNISLITKVSFDDNKKHLPESSDEDDFIVLGKQKFEFFSSQFEDIDIEGVNIRRTFEIENECGDNSKVIVFEKKGYYAGKTIMSFSENDNSYDYSYTGPSKNISHNNVTGIIREEYFSIDEATNYINNEGIGYFIYKRVVIPKIINSCFATKNSPFLEFENSDGKILYVSAVTRHPIGVDWLSYFSNQKPYFFKEDMAKTILEKQDKSNFQNDLTRILSKSEILDLINTGIPEQKQKAIEAMGIEDAFYIAEQVIHDSDEFVQQTSMQRLFEIYENKNKEELFYYLNIILNSKKLSRDVLEEIQIKLQTYKDDNIDIPEDLLNKVFFG